MLKKFHRNNRLAEHIMSHLTTWKILVKTLHIPPESLKFYVDSLDFHPFLPYSMNKKRRWEVDFLVGLEEIQDVYEESYDVLFLERTCTSAYDWPHFYECTLSEQFRIRAVHRILDEKFTEIPRKIYRKQELKSIFGQDFRNFKGTEEEENENRGIVAYNFIEPQDNFMKIFAKKCISRKCDEWPHTTGWIRIKRRDDLDMDLKLWEFQYFDDIFQDELDLMNSEELDEIENEDQKLGWKTCYNLEDHIIDKRVKKEF